MEATAAVVTLRIQGEGENRLPPRLGSGGDVSLSHGSRIGSGQNRKCHWFLTPGHGAEFKETGGRVARKMEIRVNFC